MITCFDCAQHDLDVEASQKLKKRHSELVSESLDEKLKQVQANDF